MTTTGEQLARDYFSRMQHGEPVDDLFTVDAQLLGLGRVVTGRQAIAEFYASTRGSSPTPEVIRILTDGPWVYAEIRVHLNDAASLPVVDRFETSDEGIRSLTYFVADIPLD